MGVAYRLIRPELTVEDIIKYRDSPKYRLTTSPFGITPEQYEKNPPIYVGNAVLWKGTKGIAEFTKAALAGCTTASKGKALVDGLGLAIKISKAYKGVKGTTLYKGKLYPRKCIEQKKWKEEHPDLA